MIQVDDAGWGSILGSVVIGGYRVEDGRFEQETIPISCFQHPWFGSRTYLHAAVLATARVLHRLGHSREEPLEICPGHVLDGAKAYAERTGMDWRPARITGALQDMVEAEFLRHIHGIGLTDVDFHTLTSRHEAYFHKCLRWLKGGDPDGVAVPDRERFAKTGWLSYTAWATMPFAKAKIEMMRRKRVARKNRARKRASDTDLPVLSPSGSFLRNPLLSGQ